MRIHVTRLILRPRMGGAVGLQAAARCRRRCKSASSRARRGQAIPGWRGDRRRAPASASRRNGAARAALPVGQAECATQPRHRELHDARAQRAALGADENRTIRRQDRTGRSRHSRRSAPARSAAPAPSASCRLCRGRRARRRDRAPAPRAASSPSASEMRRPEPYSSAMTAASRASTQGSRSSPARRSASATRHALSIASGFGRVLPIFGARTAASAPTRPRPSRSRNFANERKPASARIRDRLATPSARRIAMNARTSAGASLENDTKADLLAEMFAQERQALADVALIGFERLGRQPPLAAEVRQPAFYFGNQVR